MTNSKRVIALGFFDGVHIGHAELMKMAKHRAAELGAEPCVVTFDVHPDNLVFKKEVPLINSAAEREGIIRREFGIDSVVFIHFNEKVMRMDWREFIDEIIAELGIVGVVIGHDFCFGYKGLGTAERLKEYCESKDISCDIIPAVCLGGELVSSTAIRQMIADGDMERANAFLGHPHTLSDTVRAGFHLGTKMGTPTINMKLPEGVLKPRFGVYATKVHLDGTEEEYLAVTNVGVRPTVSNAHSVSVESFILDFEGDLYGRRARVDFHRFLRDERKFDSQTELAAQIRADADTTKEYFSKKKEPSK